MAPDSFKIVCCWKKVGYHKLNAEAAFFHDDLVSAEADADAKTEAEKTEEEEEAADDEKEKRMSAATRYSEATIISSPPQTAPTVETAPMAVSFPEHDE